MKNLNLLQKIDVIDSQTTKDKYNQNNSIEFEIESNKSSLYFEAFILVTGDITVNALQTMIQMLRSKIVHHFLYGKQKLMICLLMKQITFTLQCLCTI